MQLIHIKFRKKGNFKMKKREMNNPQKSQLINKAGKGNYLNADAPEKLLKYVTRTNGKSDADLIAWGGLGVSESLGIDNIIEQFHQVQATCTRKGNFGRYMDHEIYSFSTEAETAINNLDIEVDKIARKMALDFYDTDRCQVVYGIHKPSGKDTHLHIHFALNTVNFDNGNKRRENRRQTKEREERFQEITNLTIKNALFQF